MNRNDFYDFILLETKDPYVCNNREDRVILLLLSEIEKLASKSPKKKEIQNLIDRIKILIALKAVLD